MNLGYDRLDQGAPAAAFVTGARWNEREGAGTYCEGVFVCIATRDDEIKVFGVVGTSGGLAQQALHSLLQLLGGVFARACDSAQINVGALHAAAALQLVTTQGLL